MGDELETREKLLESAMAEFSENGYMKASLRKICADAGVTTGALYFFFKNKNDLFKAIVDEPLKELCRLLTEHYMQDAQDMDSDDPAVLSAEYHIDTHTDLDKLVDYMYLHYDVFMLLLTGAQGSEYENTVDMIVDMTEQGFRISAEKAAARMPNCHVDEYMLHWITHISVDAYTHLLTHERDVEKAKLHMRRVTNPPNTPYRTRRNRARPVRASPVLCHAAQRRLTKWLVRGSRLHVQRHLAQA